MIGKLSLFICFLICVSCNQTPSPSIDIPEDRPVQISLQDLSKEDYYDRILGALVGSAIGDAMGASTEMWHRADIRDKYGYIQTLTPAIRPKSAEGIWAHNMEAGSTTDDTRWKYLLTEYFLNTQNLDASSFTDFIISYYESMISAMNSQSVKSSTDQLDAELSKINWIKEWARVALARKEGGDEAEKALHRFYGGEMSCAGLLYAPMFGLIENQPWDAYEMAFEHALFDIGYARDITALSAAMTSMAMHTSDVDSIINVDEWIDPVAYRDSRLIGRIAASLTDESIYIAGYRQDITEEDTMEIIIPHGFPGSSSDWIQQEYVYTQLEKRQRAIAFHSGEIFQILITGLAYGEGDFLKTIAFIVNYGRDNDTVAAIAGFILGAKDGYKKLPGDLTSKIVELHKEYIGIDLEEMATELTEKYYPIYSYQVK